MFALIRKIPYLRNYNSSKLPDLVGKLEDHHPSAGKDAPFETHLLDDVFLRISGGKIEAARIRGKDIKTVDKLIYESAAFEGKKKPVGWPEKWPYPYNPSDAALSEDPPPPDFWPRCQHCKLEVISKKTARFTAENLRCTCNFYDDVVGKPRPLIEICEFSPMPGDPSSLNRGVRALSNIKKRSIIGEYTGELIHPDSLEDTDDYAFDFMAPTSMLPDGYLKEEQEGIGTTSNLTAQLHGNWVRFINQRGEKMTDNNCRFVQRTISGRMRIVIETRKDVRFGDELTCYYGVAYFKKDTPNKRAKTDKGVKKVKRWN